MWAASHPFRAVLAMSDLATQQQYQLRHTVRTQTTKRYPCLDCYCSGSHCKVGTRLPEREGSDLEKWQDPEPPTVSDVCKQLWPTLELRETQSRFHVFCS